MKVIEQFGLDGHAAERRWSALRSRGIDATYFPVSAGDGAETHWRVTYDQPEGRSGAHSN